MPAEKIRKTDVVRRAESKRRAAHGRPTSNRDVWRQLDDMYLKMDVLLTRLGEIQVQFDGIRAKFRQR